MKKRNCGPMCWIDAGVGFVRSSEGVKHKFSDGKVQLFRLMPEIIGTHLFIGIYVPYLAINILIGFHKGKICEKELGVE